MNVFLQPCADKQAQKNYQKTIISGVVWDDIKDCLEDRFFDKCPPNVIMS